MDFDMAKILILAAFKCLQLHLFHCIRGSLRGARVLFASKEADHVQLAIEQAGEIFAWSPPIQVELGDCSAEFILLADA
jgi:hypothetical protein